MISSRVPARFAAATLAALSLTSCLGDDPAGAEVELEVIEEVEFDPSLGIDLDAMTRLETGVYIQDLEEGEGTEEAGWGDSVVMTTGGWLRTGTQYLPVDTVEFLLGGEVVPSGVHIGMIGQRVGGIRRMIVPPELGYGAGAYQNVPAGSILIFEVDLLAVVRGS